jgi:hypothetical protein
MVRRIRASFLDWRTSVGHTRLGPLPKTRKWIEVVEQVAGTLLTGYAVPPAATHINTIAAQTLDAARAGLNQATRDPGVRYTFYLLTQVALSARRPNWEMALAKHGIRLSEDSTVFDLTLEVQGAIDRHLGQRSRRATDLSEMAQQSAGEALMSLAGTRTVNLFGGHSAEVRIAVRSLSTKKGFGQLGQRFFGRFVARFLNFYLSRATAARLGAHACRIWETLPSLTRPCGRTASRVRGSCGIFAASGIQRPNTSKELISTIHRAS